MHQGVVNQYILSTQFVSLDMRLSSKNGDNVMVVTAVFSEA